MSLNQICDSKYPFTPTVYLNNLNTDTVQYYGTGSIPFKIQKVNSSNVIQSTPLYIDNNDIIYGNFSGSITGPTGPIGATGATGPAGSPLTNFSVGEGYITISVNNSASDSVTYTVPTLNRGIMVNTDLNGPNGDISTDRIVIQRAGLYKITGWIDVKPAQNNTLITVQIGISGTPNSKSSQVLNIQNKDEERLFNTTIFANLIVGDTVSLLYSQTGHALQNLAIDRAYISVQYLSP